MENSTSHCIINLPENQPSGVDWLTLVIAGLAVVISLYTIYITNKNLKKEIRINKIEELLEILITLKLDYHSIFMVYQLMVTYRKSEGSMILKVSDEHKKKLEKLEEKLSYEQLTKAITRFQILSNSYLPNGDLKNDIYCIYDLFWKIVEDAYNRNGVPTSTAYPEGCPNPNVVNVICEDIERKLIEEMGLGYKGAKWDVLREHRNKKFKKVIQEIQNTQGLLFVTQKPEHK